MKLVYIYIILQCYMFKVESFIVRGIKNLIKMSSTIDAEVSKKAKTDVRSITFVTGNKKKLEEVLCSFFFLSLTCQHKFCIDEIFQLVGGRHFGRLITLQFDVPEIRSS